MNWNSIFDVVGIGVWITGTGEPGLVRWKITKK